MKPSVVHATAVTEDSADDHDLLERCCLEAPDYDICPDCDCELGSTPGCRLCDLDQRSFGCSAIVAPIKVR